jgi:hypothetical protein
VEKRQLTFFDANEMPEQNWAYVVERKMCQYAADFTLEGMPDTWETVPRPNHFRKEENAVARAEELAVQFKRAVTLKLVEFRVSPKYVGYVPPKDEVWIS